MSLARDGELIDSATFEPSRNQLLVSLLSGKIAYLGQASDQTGVETKHLIAGPRIVAIDLAHGEHERVLQDRNRARTTFGQAAFFVGQKQQIVSYSAAGVLRLWDSGGVVAARPLEGVAVGKQGLELMPTDDGRHLVGVDEGLRCRTWELPSGRLLKTIPANFGPMVFSDDDRYVLAQDANDQTGLVLIDVGTGKVVRRMPNARCGPSGPKASGRRSAMTT